MPEGWIIVEGVKDSYTDGKKNFIWKVTDDSFIILMAIGRVLGPFATPEQAAETAAIEIKRYICI
jgi:hypothetical protein